MNPTDADADAPRWFLMARRPGWRQIDALSDLVIVEGSVQLASLAPPPPTPTSTCAIAGCGDLARIDRDTRQLLIATVDGQLRRRFGPLQVSGQGVSVAEPAWQLTASDVLPVATWPPSSWDPVAVVPAADGQVWVVDAANQCLHLFDRRRGWLSLHPGLVVPVEPGCEPDPVAPFASHGRMVIGPLDSGREGCVWHRVVLNGDLPGGARASARTLTSELELTVGEVAQADEQWSAPVWYTDAGATQWDALVHSFPGRYLWLSVELDGDGAVTPRIDDVEVHFPSNTTRRFLPAAFAHGPDGGAFVERYLAMTDRVRSTVTSHLDGTPLLLDPDATPADPHRDFLAWLSSWMGIDDAAALPVARRRRLLRAAAELYRRRGTPEGVRRHVALWLGRQVHLLEHYRLRRWAVVHNARLGDTSRLFGPEVMRRMQLDHFSSVGEVRLLDVPDPYRDPFHFYAHRFTLAVQARGSDDPETLAAHAEHILSLVAPAHCLAEVAVVLPRMRVGVQATIGIDALVGGAPDPQPLGTSRLGHAAVVAGDPHQVGDRLGHQTRVSRTTVG